MDKYEEAGPKKVEKLVEKEVESKLHEAFNVFAVEKARSPLLVCVLGFTTLPASRYSLRIR